MEHTKNIETNNKQVVSEISNEQIDKINNEQLKEYLKLSLEFQKQSLKTLEIVSNTMNSVIDAYRKSELKNLELIETIANQSTTTYIKS